MDVPADAALDADRRRQISILCKRGLCDKKPRDAKPDGSPHIQLPGTGQERRYLHGDAAMSVELPRLCLPLVIELLIAAWSPAGDSPEYVGAGRCSPGRSWRGRCPE